MPRSRLSVNVAAPVAKVDEDADDMSLSLNLAQKLFVKDNVAISEKGVVVDGTSFSMTLELADLEVGEVLGSGACSTVRHAIHKTTGEHVALKTINLYDPSRRVQLVEEVRSLYKTDCPTIVHFYGAFFQEGSITIALEYMDGGSLANVLEQVGPIPEAVLANMTFQVLWGLGYLKFQRRIHRDIKPQNILVNSMGLVKLTDFGVSKELMTSMAYGKTFVGSFRYMAPERLQNRPHTYGADVWALGIVLIELATGRSPYDAEERSLGGAGPSYIDVVQTVIESPSPTPSGAFSKEFQDFCAACLCKDPTRRSLPDALLISPWLAQNGAVSLEASVANVAQWIASLQ